MALAFLLSVNISGDDHSLCCITWQNVDTMVPSPLKEGAYALGATRFEVIRSVIFPYTKSGLFAGILLSLGRALGETMAVTMVIGNST